MAKKRNTTEITPLLGNHPIPISTLPRTRHATRKNTESAHPLNLLREEIQASFPPSPNSYSALRSAPPPHQSNCCSPLSAGSIGPTPRACLVQWYDLHKHASGNACPAPASGGGTALPQRVFSPPGDGYGGVVSDFGGVDSNDIFALNQCQCFLKHIVLTLHINRPKTMNPTSSSIIEICLGAYAKLLKAIYWSFMGQHKLKVLTLVQVHNFSMLIWLIAMVN